MNAQYREFARAAIASASVRASDDAAQVAELEQAIAQMQINLQAAKKRAEVSKASLARLIGLEEGLE